MFETLFKIAMLVVVIGLVFLIIGLTYDPNIIPIAFKFIYTGSIMSLILVLLDIAFGD